jgi:hypothetical protein
MGYATHETRERAKRARAELSTVELLLWDQLRSRRLDGWKFRRKHPMFTFVLDFYCPAARLALQLGDVDPLLERKMHFIGIRLLHMDDATDIDQALAAIRSALPSVAASATLAPCEPSSSS